MKRKKEWTRKFVVAALTAAMVLQSPASILATDATDGLSSTPQTQSTELQNPGTEQVQSDAATQSTGNSEMQSQADSGTDENQSATNETETKASETEALETKASETETSETAATESEMTETTAPETQETPGQTLPDSTVDDGTDNSGADSEDVSGNGNTNETGMTDTVSEKMPEETVVPEQSETAEETNDPATAGVYIAQVENTSVQVKVRGEGILPEGSTMIAEAVATSDVDDAAQTIAGQLHDAEQTLIDVNAFDISIQNGAGEALHELDGNVFVEMAGLTVPEDAEQIYVYYIPKEGEPEQLKSLTREDIADGILRFETNHFSVYAVAYAKSENSGIMLMAEEVPEKITLAFEAKDVNGTIPITTLEVAYGANAEAVKEAIKIAQGNTIETIKATGKEGYYFLQWDYQNDKGELNRLSDNEELSADNIVEVQPHESTAEKGTVVTKSITYVAEFVPCANITLKIMEGQTSYGNIVSPDGSDDWTDKTIKIDGRKKATENFCKASLEEGSKTAGIAVRGWRLSSETSGNIVTSDATLTYGKMYNLINNIFKTYPKDSEETVAITGDYTIVLEFKTSAKHIGFNLVGRCDDFSNAEELIEEKELSLEGYSADGGRKYDYLGWQSNKNNSNTFTLPTYVPVCNEKKHVFVGWFDKAQADKGVSNRIFQPGEEGRNYNRGSSNATQTMDALWISIDANDIKRVYDGNAYKPVLTTTLTNESAYDGEVTDALKEVVQHSVTTKYEGKDISSLDGFTDVGIYPLENTYSIIISNKDNFSSAATREAEINSKVEITPRPVVAINSATYDYNGLEQTLTITQEFVQEETESDRGLVEKQTMTLMATVKATDAGTYIVTYNSKDPSSRNEFQVNSGSKTGTCKIENLKITDERSNDVTKNYEVIINGTLIIKKVPRTGKVTMDSWTYGEAPKEAKTGVDEPGAPSRQSPELEYKKKDEPDTAYSDKIPTDVGEYTVRATWPESDNYKETTAETTFNITERKQTESETKQPETQPQSETQLQTTPQPETQSQTTSTGSVSETETEKAKSNKSKSSKSRAEEEPETELDEETETDTQADGSVSKDATSAKTGDNTPIGRMLLLLTISGALLIFTEKRRRNSRV